MSFPRLSVLVACGTLLLGAAACGGRAGGSAQTSVDVTATDTECRVARTDLPAGTVAFKITNGGTKVTEFYVYGEGDRVMGEAENIGPGLTRELRVELSAGSYETACKPGMTGTGIRGPLRVTGAAAAADADPKLSAAIESYQGYVRGQADALVARTREFVAAVKAGDRAGALERYSHTDLWDVSADVEGAEAVVAALRPVL